MYSILAARWAVFCPRCIDPHGHDKAVSTLLGLCTSITLIVTAQIPQIRRNIGLHAVDKYAGWRYSVQVERTDAARDIESPGKKRKRVRSCNPTYMRLQDLTPFPTLITALSDAPYLYYWPNVAAGSYALTAKAIDNLGGATLSSPVQI